MYGEERRADVTRAVLQLVDERIPVEDRPCVEELARQYYATAPVEDLIDPTVGAAAGDELDAALASLTPVLAVESGSGLARTLHARPKFVSRIGPTRPIRRST